MELRATAFFSCLMRAVATDSAIGSIIHLPLKSANCELPAGSAVLTTVSLNVVHFCIHLPAPPEGGIYSWRNTTTCHALLSWLLRFRVLLAVPPMARSRVRTNPLPHLRRPRRRRKACRRLPVLAHLQVPQTPTPPRFPWMKRSSL